MYVKNEYPYQLVIIHSQIDEGSTILTLEQSSYFFSSYLVAFFLADNLAGAKYLWKRIDATLKVCETDNANFLVEVWNIGKFLFNEEFSSAIHHLFSRIWPPNFQPLIEVYFASCCFLFVHNWLTQMLHEYLLNLQLNLLASAYSVLRIDYFCNSIYKSHEEALESTIKILNIIQS